MICGTTDWKKYISSNELRILSTNIIQSSEPTSISAILTHLQSQKMVMIRSCQLFLFFLGPCPINNVNSFPILLALCYNDYNTS